MENMILSDLATLASRTSYADFDDATLHKARLHLLDTVGVTLAGLTSPETVLTLSALAPLPGGTCAIWGSGRTTDARSAALVNGISAHALELDDSGGCDHSGAVIVPAIVAALPDLPPGISGARLLHAMLIGYEVARRVLEACGGYEAHNGLGWHSTGTCGPFGAAAAVAVLHDLDPERLAMALAIAGSTAAGNWSFIRNGSQTKKLHSGRAAEGGLVAARLAAAGFTGPDALFSDVWGGFFRTYSRGVTASPAALTEDWGSFWRLNRCSIKPHATCRGTHSAIDALDLILERDGVRPADVAAIGVAISGFQNGMCGGTRLTSRAEAQMSLPYALAARLEYGTVGLDQLEPAAWSAPGIAARMAGITLNIDPAMADGDEPAITLITHQGSRHHALVEHPLGGPQNPLSDDRIIAKFEALCLRVLPRDRVEALRDRILNLSAAEDTAALLNLLR